jgi:hypothetical protein
MSADDSRRRLAGIVGLLALQAMVIVWRCRASCLFLDDFLNFELYRDLGRHWSYLTRDVFGQVAPGYRLVQALYFELFGVSYAPALVILGGLSLSITLWVILIAERARVDRGVIFAGALVHAFLLPYMHSQLWWATALHTIPSTAAFLAALWCLVGPDGAGSTRRGRRAAAILFAVALSFTAKALFAPLMMAGVVFHFRRTHGANSREALRATIGDFLGFIPVAMVYGVLVLRYGPHENPPPPQWLMAVRFVSKGFADGTVASTLGLGTYGLSLPHGLSIAVALLVTSTFALLTIRRSPSVAAIWAGFLLYFFVAMGVVARMRAFVGADAGLSLRYHCEGSTFLLLTLLLSSAGMTIERWSRATIVLASLLTAVNLQLHTGLVFHPWGVSHTCEYVRNLKADLKPLEGRSDVSFPETVIPDPIVAAWMAPYNEMTRFMTLFTRLPVVAPDRATYEVTEDGHVRHR